MVAGRAAGGEDLFGAVGSVDLVLWVGDFSRLCLFLGFGGGEEVFLLPVGGRFYSAPQRGSLMGFQRTQKSISRFPLPPNSRSPTWYVTVILSSRCKTSWKHSRE